MSPTSVALQLGDFAIIATIIGGVSGLCTTLMLFSVKLIAKRIEVVEARVSAVEDDVGDLRKEKVDKLAWARAELSTRSKVDATLERIAALGGKLDANFGMAAAVARLADEVGKLVEKKHA